jgi:hypothetical protein
MRMRQLALRWLQDGTLDRLAKEKQERDSGQQKPQP